MLKKVKIIIYIFLVIIFQVSPKFFSTTNCEQTFTFLGATSDAIEQNNITFWIGEDMSGECTWSHLIQVVISDTENQVITTPNRANGVWDSLKACLKNLEMLPYLQLEDKEDVWNNPKVSWKISAPAPDSGMIRQIYKSGYESHWTQRHGLEGIRLPEMKGVKTKLVYYYPVGLYVDYKISSVYYFPLYKSIIIFTHQPHLASGFNTMHGFLILKIIE